MNPSKTFEQLENDVKAYVKQTSELFAVLKPERKHQKRIDAWAKQWEHVYKGISHVGSFISPVNSLQVVLPKFFTTELIEKWEFWKAYLEEEHNILIRSRCEIMQLKNLQQLSKEDPAAAIMILEYAMSKRWRAFYKVQSPEDAPIPKEFKF